MSSSAFRARAMQLVEEFEALQHKLERSSLENAGLRESLRGLELAQGIDVDNNRYNADCESSSIPSVNRTGRLSRLSFDAASFLQSDAVSAEYMSEPSAGGERSGRTPSRGWTVQSRAAASSSAGVSADGQRTTGSTARRQSRSMAEARSMGEARSTTTKAGGDLLTPIASGPALQKTETESRRLRLPPDWPRGLELRTQIDRDVCDSMKQEIQESQDHWLTCTRVASRSYGPSAGDKATRRFILEPTSTSHILFDGVKLIALLYDLTFSPFSLAWELPVTVLEQVLNYILICVWFFDILLSFRTAYDSHGHLEKKPGRIARHYLRRSFALDASLVTIDTVSAIIVQLTIFSGGRSMAFGLRTVRLARIVRVLKLLRLPTLRFLRGHVLEAFHASQDFQLAFSFLRLIMFIFWFNHTISCMWFFVSWSAHSDTGSRWVDAANGDPDGTSYWELPARYQYVTALHWSLTQMTPASMQVNSLNSAERIFNIVCLVCGTLLFTFNMSLLSAKLTQRMISTKRISEQSKRLDRYLHQAGIGRSLTMRIKIQVRERLNGYKPFITHEDVAPSLSMISTSLLQELQVEQSRPPLLQHDFFLFCHRVDNKCTESLAASACSTRFLSPGDTLLLPGTAGDSAFLLLKGSLIYTQTPDFSPVDGIMEDIVRSVEWICEPAIWTNWIHLGKAEVEQASMVLQLDALKCLNALSQSPALWDVASQYGWHFHRQLAQGKEGAFASDLEHPPDLAEVVQVMASDTRLFVGLFALSIMRRSRKLGLYDRIMKYWHLDELERDLRSEHCSLSLSVKDEIVRVSSVVVASIQSSTGAFWVQLGKLADGICTADCRLPGAPCPPGEEPTAIYTQMLSGKLLPIATGVSLKNIEKEVVVRRSRHFNILTHYMQTVHHCFFTGSQAELTRQCRQMLMLRQRTRSLPVTVQIFAYEHASTVYYFAWLSQEQLENLAAASELENVQQALEDLIEDPHDDEDADSDQYIYRHRSISESDGSVVAHHLSSPHVAVQPAELHRNAKDEPALNGNAAAFFSQLSELRTCEMEF